jgi:D-alanyl-D-alanine carboxypeptidase/D-alanyl-D-alanine-endopeptidase (penicillin-binding protein 4)
MDVAIEKPAAFLGYLLAEHLLRAGIATRGRLVEKPFDMKCEFVELVEFTTPIADVLHRSNKNSLNLASEALVKTMAAHGNPDRKGGSWDQGGELIARYLSNLGIPLEEFNIDDGSGLSRENRLSANAITTVLLDMYKSDDWRLFRGSLSVGGVDGTVDDQFKTPKYRGKVLAKTGTIAGVKSLSGVCLTGRGPYLFSILSNRYSLSPDRVYGVAEAIIDEYAPDDEEDAEPIN